MTHGLGIIFAFTIALTLALVFGFITQKMRLSPIVGYLIAGIIIGPYVPGIAIDIELAHQLAEIGVILLMFSVGMHFQISDLLAVKKIAVPGAIMQIAVTTLFAVLSTGLFGWSVKTGIVFGIAISVASTVVLVRVLTDNKVIHTPTGHVAVGWLLVEDLFTIFVLVMLPIIFAPQAQGEAASGNLIWQNLALTFIRLGVLFAFILVVGQKLLPKLLEWVAKTGTRDLFTLAVFVVALGMAVGAAEFFGASIALGAFLAGMVVGQSEFSARAASEALPMRDIFAVIFFMSVGMLFNPASVITEWKLLLVTLAIVLVIKPLVAIAVVMILKNPLKKAITVGVTLAQIGEFTFIVASLGVSLGILPQEASNAIIAAAIISITLNPLLYRGIKPFVKFLEKMGIGVFEKENADDIPDAQDEQVRVIMVGYGHVGRTVTPKLLDKNIEVAIIEMNIDTVHEVQKNSADNLFVIYGDAAQKEALLHAGIEKSEAIVISASVAPASEIVEMVRSLNPGIRIYIHTTYISEAKILCEIGANAVFSGEAAAALYLSEYLFDDLDPNGRFREDSKSVCEGFGLT